MPDTPGDLFWEMNKPEAAFEQNVVGIVVVRADGTIAYINPYFASLIGELPADLVGKPLLDFASEQDKATVADVIKDCVSGTRRFVQFETTVTHKSGNIVDIFVNASTAVFEGQPASIGVLIDISARKHMEAELRASEAKYANALKMVGAADWEYDVLADRFTFNDNFYRLCHTTADAAGGYTMSSADFVQRFVHPDDRQAIGAEMKAAIETNDPDHTLFSEHHVLFGDGTPAYASVHLFIVKDQAGQTIECHGVFQDLTERKQMEMALADSEAKLQSALANMVQGLLMLDAEGGLVLSNRRYAEIFGLPQDQIEPGMTVPELMALSVSNSGFRDLDPEGTVAHAEEIIRGAESQPVIVNLSDGRSIVDTFRPMPDGGVVVTFEDITEKKKAEQALADSESKLQAALSNMSQGLAMLDAQGRLVLFNPRYAEIFGMPPDRILPGMTTPELMALATSITGVRDLDPEGTVARAENVLRGGEGGSFVQKLSDGRSLTTTLRLMPDGGVVATFEDITQKMEAEQALVDSESKLQSALSNMSQGLLMLDAEGRLVLFNSRVAGIYRLPPKRIKVGMTMSDLLAKGPSATGVRDVNPEATVAELGKAFRDPAGGTYVQHLTNGSSIAASFKPMPNGGIVVTIEDITEKLEAEEKIRHLAQHDGLTNLPNRATFYDQMDTITRHVRPNETIGVLSLDLDNFKAVNDTLGHPVGDLLLQTAARRMQNCLRGGDIVARLGGDEFAILQIPVEKPADITALATRLIEVVGGPYDLDNRQVVVGVSVGIAIAPDDGDDPDTLMKNADLALYRAKADGGGVYRFFEVEMDALMQARRVIELDLRRAISNGDEFELVYQPIVVVKTGKIASCEALVRWHHPERGLIMPMEFIPVAEATGLIVQLGEWVLRHACAEAACWPKDITVAVNLSPAQFKSKNLVLAVTNALAASGLPASRLEIEITELVLLEESDGAFAILHQLRELGIRIAMDDFGTGYSSLGYLRSFPFNTIKIDQSFIRELPGKEDSLAIVRAVVALSSSLGIKTIAEGVETEAQLASIVSEGCTQSQGFLFSKPRPSTEVRQMLSEQAETEGDAT